MWNAPRYTSVHSILNTYTCWAACFLLSSTISCCDTWATTIHTVGMNEATALTIQELRELSLDVDATCTRLVMILADPLCYKEILSWRGEPAQSLINLLQTVCLSSVSKLCSDSVLANISFIHSFSIWSVFLPSLLTGAFFYVYSSNYRDDLAFIPNVWSETMLY